MHLVMVELELADGMVEVEVVSRMVEWEVVAVRPGKN